MPLWNNAPLMAYHGTILSELSRYQPVESGKPLLGFQVDLNRCRPMTDFGRGFYVTSSLKQARNWANIKAGRKRSQAVVLAFELDRDWLASLQSLCFVISDTPFYDLVEDCRNGTAPHQRSGSQASYDVVYGPVTLWPQDNISHDGDQVSFHSNRAVSDLPEPVVFDIATRNDGKFPRSRA